MQIVSVVLSLVIFFSGAIAVTPCHAASEVPSQLSKLSAIVGRKVETPQGEQRGHLEEIVIDAASADVAYAVLGFGGFLGMGEKLVIIPWGALQPASNDTFHTNVTEEQIKNAPSFDQNTWPDDLEAKHWSDAIHDYYGQAPYWRKRLPAEETRDISQPVTPRLVRSSLVLRAQVMNTDNQYLGDIEEVVMDPSTGDVVYAVLAFGEFLGLGGKWFAIPWRALQTSPGFGTFTLDVDKDRLKNAPGFDKNQWPDMVNPRWNDAIRNYWQQPQ